MNKISIIIPVYGVESYIERCARSLFEQTLDDIEYIFVNDCTKDRSIIILKNIIEQYPQRKKQVRIINHDENKGLPIARQTGMKYANGKYIIHCDSDDWLDPQMCELMWSKAEDENLDVVICDYYEDTGRNKVVHVIDEAKGNFYYSYFSSNNVCAVWNKCIKKNLYDNEIIYPTAGMGEDYALIIQLLFYAEKIDYIHQPLYHYFKNENSITNAVSEESALKRFNQSVANMKTVMSFAQKHDLDKLYHYDLDKLKFSKRNNILPLIKKEKYYKMWLNTFPEISLRILFNPRVSLKEKTKYIIAILFN